MDTPKHSPVPFFDTFEHLESPINVQSLSIEKRFQTNSLPAGATYVY